MCRHLNCVYYIFLLYIASAWTDGGFRFDYYYVKELEGWLKPHLMPATFKDAFLRCNLEGAVLASPLDRNLHKAMEGIQAASGVACGIFTGIHATFSKGDFTSIEGVPLEKIPLEWALDEPDNFKNQEDCIIMLPNGTVADVRCDETFPYVCYRKKVNSPVITACGTVDPEYKLESSTGSCYKFHGTGRTWRNAQRTCLAQGGYLAIPNSAQEATVLKNIFAGHPANTIKSEFKDVVALGFLDWDQKRTWYTVHGQTIEEAGYASWAGGQPDNSRAHDNGSYCGAMFRTGLLDDIWCESVPFAFICEKAPDSLVADDEKQFSLGTIGTK
ncbi:C-type mannose receptor 2-like isoform X1 [Ostrinia furnacalis]|uniref:C-type mannose receptor 2-like isoform X1 n=1 Tax=Ostrinia furnacalis TaxID=93504 RepID=UPI00103CF460|nr:C-type mannose receptor 2-like isoform X1 [Ostrinia furnacalis]